MSAPLSSATPPSSTPHARVVAALLVLFAAMWLGWLYALHTHDSSAQDVSAHAPTRCRHVAPVLRTTLLVLTVLLACSAGVLLGKMFFGDTPTERWVHRGIPYTALVAVFLLQLVYLVRVGSDRHGPGRSGGCVGDGMRRGQWWALVAFAVVQLVFGGWLFVEG